MPAAFESQAVSISQNPVGEARPLKGQRVCVTGTLAAMSHSEFGTLVAECGGRFRQHPVKRQCLLVIGANGWPAHRDGSASTVFKRARNLKDSGFPIEFLSEEEFFRRIGLVDREESLRGRFTISELSHLLGVTAASLRRWTRLGLIQPVETIHRFSYFTFAEVASARRLCELVSAGASPARIRQGLEQFRAWLPAADVSFAQLSLVERSGQILMRLRGALVAPSGQRHFDFETLDADEPGPLVFQTSVDPALGPFDSLFDQALSLEDRGRFTEAADAYRQASRLSPKDPAVHFNLGNVLYQMGRLVESLDSYRQALRFDPEYAEAWNNLGNVLWQTGVLSGALQAFDKALALVPNYADARHNLEVLRGKLAAAPLEVVS